LRNIFIRGLYTFKTAEYKLGENIIKKISILEHPSLFIFKYMKLNIRDYFYFSKTQRNGLIIVICLIYLSFFLSNILSDYLSNPATDFSEFKEEVSAFDAETARLDKNNFEENLSEEAPKEINPSIQLFQFDPNIVTKEALIKLGIKPTVAKTFIKYRNTGARFYKKQDIKKVFGITDADYNRLESYIYFKQKKDKPKTLNQPKIFEKSLVKPIIPFVFNPNEATKETLLNLGLSEKVAQTVINFRSKGGQFRKKQDFKKIYGLAEKDYLTLAPYMEITPIKRRMAEGTNISDDIPESFSTETTFHLDINNSSVEDWKQLSGIGEITAKRIVNFRDKLGGFVSIEQIKMTYNLPDSVIEKVATQLIVSPIPNKILINTLTAEELKLHPYIKTKQAHIIINYRVNHGNYQNIEDLYKVKALKPDFFEQIQPYLSFE